MIKQISQLTFIALVWTVTTSHAEVAFNLTALSSPRVGFSAIEAASKVYFIGGFEHGDLRATSTIEVYDLIAQNMSSPLHLDSPRAFVTPVVIEPNIYLVGGLQYINPTVGYDRVTRQFTNYGNGPTVVNTQRIALHDSFLAVIGINGVDVLDVLSGNWTDTAPLRTLLAGMAQCAIFSEEGLVIVLGGVNVATGVYSNSAWVYNMTSGEIHEHADLVPTPFTAINATGSFASNGVVAIQTTDSATNSVLLYHAMRRSWKIIEITATHVLSVPDVTFTFNNTVMFTTYWNSTDGEPVLEFFGADLKHAFISGNYVVQMIRVAFGASMVFRIYYPATDIWVSTTPIPVIEVVRSVSLEAGWQVIMTTSNTVYGYSPSLNQLHQVVDADMQPFGIIAKLIPAEEPDQVYIFEYGGKVTKTQFFEGGIANLIKQQPCIIIPNVRVGSDFLNLQGQVMTSGNWAQLTVNDLPPISFALFDSDKNSFVLTGKLDTNTAKVNHYRVDIYNYITTAWNSTEMPAEFVNMDFEVEWFYSAVALNNKLVVWMNTVMAVYDPSTSNWTTYTNYLQSDINNQMSLYLHLPVPTAQGLAFMRTNNNTFDMFSNVSLPLWNSTSPAPIVENTIKYVFQQCIVRNDSQLYMTSRALSVPGNPDLFNLLFIYDISADKWRYEQLPSALSSVPTIAFAGDYLLSMNDGVLSYRDLINGGADAQLLDFTFSPAVVLETSTNVTLIAGGIQAFKAYVDRIMIIPHSAITISPPVSNSTVLEPIAPSLGLSEAELIVAIVVPIGAALIATALLVFFLVRRQKRRKQGSSTVIGLAGQYGQWFIPFESIKFGAQLGQGASGQAFKGTWNGTTVALKVSMTQANSAVIGELELMMHIRPHPNVIQLFGFSAHPETDSIILVIEYCNNGSLDDTLCEAQPISVQQKLSWLLSMAKGIEHLHSNNIVHRDIAARNVLLHQNEPKMTDFGMSRLINEDKQRGTTKSELGPIRWMAPESLKNKEYSNKSDIWSFGVLMFEVVAQVEPHTEADPIEIGRLIRDNGVTPTIPSSCPPKLAQLIKECWHMSPDKRISIDQIVLQLEAMQDA